MKWLVVVLFANIAGDVYIFTEPSFDTRDECMSTLHDPKHIYNYTQKLLLEYGEVQPIRFVNCLQQDEIERIIINSSGLKAT
jgi:hypothetical protein